MAESLFADFISSPELRAVITRCVNNGHTWDCESLANLAHMFIEKRVVLKRFMDIPMYCAQLHKNENRWPLLPPTLHLTTVCPTPLYPHPIPILPHLTPSRNRWTQLVTGWTVRLQRSGSRRMAVEATPFLVPRVTPTTTHYVSEALARMHAELVDPTGPLPASDWPALCKPVSLGIPTLKPKRSLAPPRQPYVSPGHSSPPHPNLSHYTPPHPVPPNPYPSHPTPPDPTPCHPMPSHFSHQVAPL